MINMVILNVAIIKHQRAAACCCFWRKSLKYQLYNTCLMTEPRASDLRTIYNLVAGYRVAMAIHAVCHTKLSTRQMIADGFPVCIIKC